MIQIIALLYVSKNGLEGLRVLESEVIPILIEHGGVMISASSNLNRCSHDPDEVHVIQFPSHQEFEAYRNDQRVIDLGLLKDKMIHRMEVHITDSFHEYS
jgi:uncharacterized protein (DUF1330 family)